MDSYLEYLIEKFLIFDKRAELDESNSIDDIEKIRTVIKLGNKRLSDDIYISVTSEILEKFNCYDILNKGKKDVSCSEEVYMLYKNYKMSSVKKVECKAKCDLEVTMDDSLDVSGVKYVCDVGFELNVGRLPVVVKGDNKKWSKEYKFRVVYKKRKYIFSVYDWVGKQGWYVGCDNKNAEVTSLFLDFLKETSVQVCC